jgi:hypothetical protein
MTAPSTELPATFWRASGLYLPSLASKAGLLDEARQFLHTYAQLGSFVETRRALVDGELPQRARETRETIVTVLQQRLTRWSPPAWVLADLAAFAADTSQPSLQAALLLHVVRQDVLLYDFVQQVVVPNWHDGERMLIRADVQRFLDQAQPAHAEIDSWSHATREKLAGNVLSVLRDYGLLQGRDPKQIIEPFVPEPVAEHLVRLLRAGYPRGRYANRGGRRARRRRSPRRARAMLRALAAREAVV